MARKKQKETPFDDVILAILEPRLFRSIEQLCSAAIQYSGNNGNVRTQIGRLIVDLRKAAHARFGHNSSDAIALSALLDRTAKHYQPDPVGEPKQRGEPDTIKKLWDDRKLTPEQVSAAQAIRSVWTALGRCLAIAGRDFGAGGGSKRARALGPFDVMGEEVHSVWKNTFAPWYTEAGKRYVNKKGEGRMNVRAVVFEILVENRPPVQVDKMYDLDEGRALRILRDELLLFFG